MYEYFQISNTRRVKFKWCDMEVDITHLIYQNEIKIYSKDTLLVNNLSKTQKFMKLRNSDEELYVPKNEYWRIFSSMFRCQF